MVENEDKITTDDELEISMKARVESDKKRYLKYYGRTFFDESEFDVVIDSTNKTIEEVFNEVWNVVKDKV